LEITKAFSLVLLRIRKEKGLTHEKLAELAGLHPTTLSLLERNKRQPSITTIFLLASGLGVEPEDLVSEVRKLHPKLRK
jgi:transcriptional regulator with XRE-family HTH domain